MASKGAIDNYRLQGAMKFLLDHGANVDQLNQSGETPLSVAVAQELFYMRSSFINLLLYYGANVNQPNRSGELPLLLTMQPGVPTNRKLENGADPNMRNEEGLMPIEYVNDPMIRRLLLRHGAVERIGIPSDSEQSPETLSTTTSRVVNLSERENWKEREIIEEEQRLAIEKLRTAEHLKKRAVEAADKVTYTQWLKEQEDKEGWKTPAELRTQMRAEAEKAKAVGTPNFSDDESDVEMSDAGSGF